MKYLTQDDIKSLKFRLKQKRKEPLMRLFIASKTGGNSMGKGAERSVILGTFDGKKWNQAEKFWGRNNEERAKEFIETFNNPPIIHIGKI